MQKIPNKKRSPIRSLAEGAMIAALYAAITLLLAPISFGTFDAVQFRVAEALTILPALTFSSIPGLTIGCIIANAAGVATGANIAGWWDVLFGSLATFLAALCTRALRHVKVKGLPVLAPLPPVIFNGLIVGYELSIALGMPFPVTAATVALGELVVCYALGLPLYILINKINIFDRRL